MLTVFSIFPSFAIQTELVQASGITAARRISRPNYGFAFVAVPACFVCQAVRALSRTVWCLFGGGWGIFFCVITIFTLFVTVSIVVM
jgi:hypothetical protein